MSKRKTWDAIDEQAECEVNAIKTFRMNYSFRLYQRKPKIRLFVNGKYRR